MAHQALKLACCWASWHPAGTQWRIAPSLLFCDGACSPVTRPGCHCCSASVAVRAKLTNVGSWGGFVLRAAMADIGTCCVHALVP